MNDDQVLQLWLKRNPLRPVAGPILGDLLAANTTLAVLDLVNCGLLDDGVSSVFDGLEASGDASALEHLYLDGNGIRFEACTRIGAFLRQGKGRLKTLSLGCSRMGDSGLKLLADALMEPGAVPLTRLCVASCGISSVGANCLAALLDPASKGSEARAPPSLRRLDVGMLKVSQGQKQPSVKMHISQHLPPADRANISPPKDDRCVGRVPQLYRRRRREGPRCLAIDQPHTAQLEPRAQSALDPGAPGLCRPGVCAK
mmetsp:Transcript_48953/g.138256  ORF Transcript_48953/g.138256 Transcript_48953/m.138256 type:complete len:257 (-) Transcript_48953:435-1205(-)